MPALQIYLMNGFQVRLGEDYLDGFESDKVRSLLAYLVIENQRAHRRETIAELLWPDRPEQVGRNNLKQALANLRRVVDNNGANPPYITTTRAQLAFNCESDYWLDVEQLMRADAFTTSHSHQSRHQCAVCIDHLSGAIELYQTIFLNGLYLGDSLEYDEWVTVQREKLRLSVMAALEDLTQFHERKQSYEQALNFARRALEIEPWDERFHRVVMRALAGNRQWNAALKHYEYCRQLLMDELGVTPGTETEHLYQQLLELRSRPVEDSIELTIPPPLSRPDLPVPPSSNNKEPASFRTGIQIWWRVIALLVATLVPLFRLNAFEFVIAIILSGLVMVDQLYRRRVARGIFVLIVTIGWVADLVNNLIWWPNTFLPQVMILSAVVCIAFFVNALRESIELTIPTPLSLPDPPVPPSSISKEPTSSRTDIQIWWQVLAMLLATLVPLFNLNVVEYVISIILCGLVVLDQLYRRRIAWGIFVLIVTLGWVADLISNIIWSPDTFLLPATVLSALACIALFVNALRESIVGSMA